jgi:hypothetical protein
MEEVNKSIVQFIKKHHVFNLAVYSDGMLWTASCFYAFWQEEMALVFLSDEDTKHSQMMLSNPNVVGTITLETRIIGKIQGLQFIGEVQKLEKESSSLTKRLYYKRFPYTLGTQSAFWLLTIHYAKLTDNRLGFGKKIVWEEEESTKYKVQSTKYKVQGTRYKVQGIKY